MRHIIWTSLFVAQCIHASSLSFEQQFDNLIKKQIPNAAVGLVVSDPKTHQVLFEQRAEENFCPASNTKLFTAAAALKFFGPDFQFQTSLHTHSDKLDNGILKDNLYLVFRGDPTLTLQDINALMQKLKENGVHQIQGNVVIDDTAFENPPYAPGWTWESIPWYYSAPVTAVILNENKVRLKLNKPSALGKSIAVEQADSNLPALSLKTHITAVTLEESEKNCQLHAEVKNNAIDLTGCWPLDKTPSFIEIALDAPRALAQTEILNILKKQGIQLSGKVILGKVPAQTPTIMIKRSAPLKTLLIKVLGDSNNLYTESLTKALGIAYAGKGSFQAGTTAIKEILKRDNDVPFGQIQLSDGSGQSRYNLVSPYLISELLQIMYQDPNYGVYYHALSTSGKKGTLAARMQTPDLAEKVVAKTGTVTGTSALSGYIKTKKGNEYVFALMINQATKNGYALKAFEDSVCQLIAEDPWSTAPTTS